HLTDLILLLGKAITMLAHTEEMLERLCRHSYLEALLADVFLDCLAANLGDLPLQAAHARLAGVVANDVANGRLIELQLALLQAVGLDLLGRQVLDGDVDLLILGVTRQTD